MGIKPLQDEGDSQRANSCKDLDDVLAVVGSQGRYQKIFLYAILSPLIAIQPIIELNLLFLLYEPDHWCKVPGREEAGVDLETWKNLTIPREADGSLSKCQMFGANRSRTGCTWGWDYDKKDYDHTIPLDFDWVCERGEWATWALTANSVGHAIGTVALGPAADKIGRKPVFIVSLFLVIFGRIASLYVVDNFWVFTAVTLVTGMGFPQIFLSPTMIGAEFSGNEFRAWIYSWTWIIWVVGMGALPWVAYFARHWYIIGLTTTIPITLAFVLCVWVPESPRWLLSQGRVEAAAEVIKEIARGNGTEDKLSDPQLDSMLKQIVAHQRQACHQERRCTSVLSLFSKWRLGRNTLLVTISWVMNAVIYYGITLNASHLSGNQFLNFFILAVIEVPAGYAGSVLCDRVGRRWTQVLFFMLSVASSVLAGVAADFKEDGTWTLLSVTAAVVAKFSITLTFLVVYLQATEIFPTPLRSTGSGFASTTASVTGIFTPYIIYSGKFHAGAPWFIIGGMSIVGVLSSAYLPETLNQRLPETLEEAAAFGKGNKFWSFRPPHSSVSSDIKSPTTTTTPDSDVVKA